jgi:hypothetical protein
MTALPPTPPHPSRRALPIAAVALPPLLLAGLGVNHPELLNAQSAGWWTTLHFILLPLFPLLAVVVWVLVRDDRSAMAWAARIAAVVFVVFYGALDAVAGIAAGTVVQAGAVAGSPEVSALFLAARPPALVGVYAMLAALILVLGSAWRLGARGPLFFIAAVVLLASGYSFTTSHIYFPRGVATMIGFALGFALLEFVRRPRTLPAATPAAA